MALGFGFGFDLITSTALSLFSFAENAPYFPVTPSFTISGSGLGGYSTSYNPEDDKPTTTKTIYVTKGGAGSQNGTSLANAYDSLVDAVSDAETNGDGRIIVDGGGVFRTGAGEMFTGFSVDNEDIIIEAQNGRPVLASALNLTDF